MHYISEERFVLELFTSRTMLATARPSCYHLYSYMHVISNWTYPSSVCSVYTSFLLFPPKELEKPGRKLRCCWYGFEVFVKTVRHDGALAQHAWCHLNMQLHKQNHTICMEMRNAEYLANCWIQFTPSPVWKIIIIFSYWKLTNCNKT